MVTDKESVEKNALGRRPALEANDPQAVIRFIDPASPMRSRVAQ